MAGLEKIGRVATGQSTDRLGRWETRGKRFWRIDENTRHGRNYFNWVFTICNPSLVNPSLVTISLYKELMGG